MLIYPEGLPLPLREGYGLTQISPVTSTKMVTGRSRRRRTWRSTPAQVAVSWLMTSTQAKIFMAWYEHAINAVDWFLCPIKSPLGLELTKSQFTDIYQGPVLVGVDMWRFTAVIELFKLPIISEAELTDLLAGMDIGVMNAQLRSLLERWYTKSWPGAT